MTQVHDATQAQIRAADPTLSTWVSANAGSGKTRVLTDRVARLLLHRVPPQRILCLTYTKAAAAHMQNQLFRRLGEWAMLPDDDLRGKLADLGEETADLDPDTLSRARTLFASALETPGGLKIQTIHSFCASLLRRFPLEAGVSPQFQEMDDRSNRKIRADILESLADGKDIAAFDAMARYLTGPDADALALEITRNRENFDAGITRADIWAAFDLPQDYSPQTYLDAVLPDWADDVLADLATALATGKTTDLKNADVLAPLIGQNVNMAIAEALETMFVFGSDLKLKTPDCAKLNTFPTKDVRAGHPDLMEAVDDLMLRFQDAKPHRLALAAAQKTQALHRFAQAFLPEYDRVKQLHGWLDFDDLILKAKALLSGSDMAQWVLFKLDGGIDHILVDEAQDTSPEQWAVIARLAEEFSAGIGARDVNRTLFVVGDEKQSIYSFQGADPAAFDRMRAHFEQHLEGAQNRLWRRDLLYSFRSSAAVLRLVDLVLQNTGDTALKAEVTHRAYHDTLPGRVDLWPFKDKPEALERPVWHAPLDVLAPNDPALDLARQIAEQIKGIIDSGASLPTTQGMRRIVPGDFLILVQRRLDLFHEIIKALKDLHLPVAGADRLRIGGELAVRDLTALLSFMATPEDDLSLASVLRSPLFGFSESALYQLAQPRKGYLWQALRDQQSRHSDTFTMLDDLLGQADFLRPYELLERILTRHHGRNNLIARLGREAEDGIDALLSQAMQYEQMEPPSLTGFLGWMSTDESDIKRQMDSQSNEIRVMTVHGAKGLESPIVILPDTAKRGPSPEAQILHLDGELPAWNLGVKHNPLQIREAREARQIFQQQERLRLLYVALTRAENWLIVCGAGNLGQPGESWYSHVETALEQAGAGGCDFQGLEIQRYQPFPWEGAAQAEAAMPSPTALTLPDWARQPTPKVATIEKPLNPSDLGGAKIVAGAYGGQMEAAALRHGRLIHLLLEHLPGVTPQDRQALAGRVLAAGDDPVESHEINSLLVEVTAILDDPSLAFLFQPGTLAEVAITAEAQDMPIIGVIDRLIVEENQVLAVDYKTNAATPAQVGDTPEGLLRQMGAYRAVLARIYPDRDIKTAILWTKTADLMPLPQDIVTAAFARAPTS